MMTHSIWEPQVLTQWGDQNTLIYTKTPEP